MPVQEELPYLLIRLSNIVFCCLDVPPHLFNKFPIDGHLGCFQCFAIRKKAAINTLMHISFCTYEHITVG